MRNFDSLKWFNLWYEDKENILVTMYRNMQDDINAGYNPTGTAIKKQREDIEAWKAVYYAQLDKMAEFDDNKLERYCYIDMKRRGVI